MDGLQPEMIKCLGEKGINLVHKLLRKIGTTKYRKKESFWHNTENWNKESLKEESSQRQILYIDILNTEIIN